MKEVTTSRELAQSKGMSDKCSIGILIEHYGKYISTGNDKKKVTNKARNVLCDEMDISWEQSVGVLTYCTMEIVLQ